MRATALFLLAACGPPATDEPAEHTEALAYGVWLVDCEPGGSETGEDVPIVNIGRSDGVVTVEACLAEDDGTLLEPIACEVVDRTPEQDGTAFGQRQGSEISMWCQESQPDGNRWAFRVHWVGPA